MSEKLYINWDEFHRHTKQLAAKIKQNGNYNKIIAISRGGLMPAGILAYELDIRNVEVVNMSTYDGEQQRAEQDMEISAAATADEQTLIVDDISDTGKTFNLLRPKFPKATFVTVYTKEQGAPVVDMHIKDIPDIWLVFPWD